MENVEIIKALKRGLTQQIAGLRQAVSSLNLLLKEHAERAGREGSEGDGQAKSGATENGQR
jgi:hypothetical protein